MNTTILARFGNAKSNYTEPVPAWKTKFPHFAVTKSNLWREYYSLTHVPTGCAIFGSIPTIKAGRELAEKVARIKKIDWSLTDFRKFTPQFNALPKTQRAWLRNTRKRLTKAAEEN